MFKRVISMCLAVMLAVGMMVCMTTPAHAAYENTHVNTGNQREDIIAIAVTQLGYGEGSGGYTKYGEFHGNSYADWCGYFVSWCARQADVPTSVLPKQGWAKASAWGLSTFTASQRTPQPGDLYFRGTAHVGFVYYVSGNYFYTLEGNSVGDKVVTRALSLYSSSYSFASPNYGGSSNNSGHTHALETTYESAHPHKEYKKCACGYTSYTGNTKTVDSCTECIQANCSHSYSSWESTGDSKHKKTCSKCGKVVSENHGWTDVEVLKYPSCKESGSKTQTCSTCGADRTVTLKRTDDHKYGDWEYYNSRYHIRTCEVCEKVDTKSHSVDEDTWKADETMHWHACTDCGEQYDETEHVFGAACVSPCETCWYVRPQGHHYGTTWKYDTNVHWQTCEDCGEITLGKDHEFDNDCDADCNVCGYRRDTDHSYGETLHADAEGHWYECDVCGHKGGHSGHVSSAKATRTAAEICTECGYEMTPIVVHEHSFSYTSDANTHWGVCECGEKQAAEGHAWDMATGRCSVCQVVSVQETESRSWDFVWLIVAGAVVTTTAVTAAVVVRNGKKRKAGQMA